MYPTLTWQQEALAFIKEKHNVVIPDNDALFTLGTHDPSGALHFTLFLNNNDLVYLDYPLRLLFQRRNIERLFVGFLPETNAQEGETYGTVLSHLLSKYGLDIPLSNFSDATLAQTVSFNGKTDTVLTLDIDQSKSEQWIGNFPIRVRASSAMLA